MRAVMLKSLLAHKRRLFGTFLAVLLGVSFLFGTLVLGDTLRSNFNDLFSQANAGTDVLVRRASQLDTDPGAAETQRGLIDQSLVTEVAAVQGVAAAEPSVEGYGQLLRNDGTRIGGNGPPTLAGNWLGESDLNPYRLVEGRAPRSDSEVVVNRGAAEDGDLELGTSVRVLTPKPIDVTVVGIATFGSADGLGPTTFTAFTLPAAQRYLLGGQDEITSISLKASPGVSQRELAASVTGILPERVEAITGDSVTQENTSDINATFLDFFTTFLLLFAGVALLVATFSIYNTFSIIVAQRTRESALLRAVGASRGQVLSSVVVEALAVGMVASGAGLLGGLGVVGLLKAMFDAFGFVFPAGGLAIRTSGVVIALGVGIATTVLAGLVPAVRASRVPPLEALRDVAVDRSGASVARTVAGFAVLAIGVGLVLSAALGGGDTMLSQAGLGAVITIVGVVVLGPVVARVASAAIGAPLPRLRGVTGSLARENAMRSPSRTAGTASALMVGIAVVSLFTVFAASLKASVDQTVTRSFHGDLVISTGAFGGGVITPELAGDLDALPEVRTATGLGSGRARIGRTTENITVVDPVALGRVLDLGIIDGTLASLGAHGVAVSRVVAEDHGWTAGDPVPVTFSDGTSDTFTIGAVYAEATNIVGAYVITRDAWAAHAVQDSDTSVLVALENGVDFNPGRTAVNEVAEAEGAPDAMSRGEYADSLATGVDLMLGVVYALLTLAVVIALMGIANTLALSTHERARELGLLRAIGQTQRQLRSMVRWESVIIAVFGAFGGLALGVFLGWALVQSATDSASGMLTATFAAPLTQLVGVLVIGGLAGVLAAFRPARRAARIDVLASIAGRE
jgi:putative ABC transport system permease protein